MNRTLAASLIIFLFSVPILAYFICDLNQDSPTETKPVVGDLTYANPQKLGTNVWGIFLAPSDVGPGASLLVWNGSV